jgi:hypothetical protein
MGREPLTRISTSLLALCRQSELGIVTALFDNVVCHEQTVKVALVEVALREAIASGVKTQQMA